MAEPIRPISQAIVTDTIGVTTGTQEQQQDALALAATDLPPVTSDGLEQITVQDRPGDFTSISNFLAQNQITGFSKSNRFLVNFNFNYGILSELNYSQVDSLLTFKCEQAEFPGREFVSTDARIYGPSYKSPNMSSYGDVNLTLLCDSALTQKQIMETWMSSVNSPNNFDFNYRDTYVCDVTIQQYNEINEVTFQCTLREAYPISVTPLQTNWADDGYHKLQVTLTYRYWVSEIVKKNDQLNYDRLRTSHINRVGATGLSYFEDNSVRNLEHRRRITRVAEESTNNFRQIINELTLEE